MDTHHTPADDAPNTLRIEPLEFLFPILLALTIVVLGTLPYLYGYMNATEEMQFMGLVGRDLSGGNGYLMLARQAQDGYHLFENLASPEPLPRAFFNVEWWTFGNVARFTGLSLIATFHVGRALTVLGFALSVYYLAALCLRERFWRRLALTWIMIGAGLGWIPWLASQLYAWFNPEAAAALPDRWISGVLFQGYRYPLPFDVAGASIPAYLINKPHFIRAGICVAMSYALLIQGCRTSRWRYFIGSGIFALLHAAIRPFGLPEMGLMYVLLPVLLALRDRSWKPRRFLQCATAAAFLVPAILYYAYLAATNALGSPGPDFPPPPPLATIMWFGLPLILSAIAAIGLMRARAIPTHAVLLVLWIVLAAAIGHAYPLFRAGMEGALYAFAIASVLLAVSGPLQWIQRRWNPIAAQRRARGLAVALVVLSAPSAAIASAHMLTMLRDRPTPYYLHQDILEGLQWLDDHGRPGEVVLSDFDVGQVVPRMTGLKAYLGHWMLTPNFWDKHAAFVDFVKATDGAAREDFLARNPVDYLLWGPQERQAASADPATIPSLDPVFTAGQITIFRVHSGRVD